MADLTTQQPELHWTMSRTPSGGARALAHCVLSNGIELDFAITLPAREVQRIMREMMERAPIGANIDPADPFGWNPFKKLLSGKLLKKALNGIAQATLLPAAAGLARKVAKATGLPIDPSQIGKAFKLGVALVTKNPLAIAAVKKMGALALTGNPIAAAGLMALRLASKHIPIIKKVAAPALAVADTVSGDFGWAPANDAGRAWRPAQLAAPERPRFLLTA